MPTPRQLERCGAVARRRKAGAAIDAVGRLQQLLLGHASWPSAASRFRKAPSAAFAVRMMQGRSRIARMPSGDARPIDAGPLQPDDRGVRRRVLAGRAGAPKAAGSGSGPAAPMSWPAYRARRIARGRPT